MLHFLETEQHGTCTSYLKIQNQPVAYRLGTSGPALPKKMLELEK